MHGDVRQCGGIGTEPRKQRHHVRHISILEGDGQAVGQLALAASLVHQDKQIDHDTAGLPVGRLFVERFEGPPADVARTDPIAMNEARTCPSDRRFAEHDMGILKAETGRPETVEPVRLRW